MSSPNDGWRSAGRGKGRGGRGNGGRPFGRGSGRGQNQRIQRGGGGGGGFNRNQARSETPRTNANLSASSGFAAPSPSFDEWSASRVDHPRQSFPYDRGGVVRGALPKGRRSAPANLARRGGVSSIPPPKNFGFKYRDICIPEEIKIVVTQGLEDFLKNEDRMEFTFPPSLSNTERAFVHRYCQSIGLKSKSYGMGEDRRLTVTKVSENIVQGDVDLRLGNEAALAIAALRSRDNGAAAAAPALHQRADFLTKSTKSRRAPPRLNHNAPPLLVPPPKPSPLSDFRRSLPIFPSRAEILDAIHANRVVLVVGETGSGKTTQVPQFILERERERSAPCRLVCAEPRRLATMAVAERIASERGERLGETVGFQVRLEGSVSEKTLCTFCTYGVLLRYLMSESGASNVTHVIVDEIHERDKMSDFLLVELKNLLLENPRLRLILMSASMNLKTFVNYFPGCAVVDVPGRMFEVEDYFLEDVLQMTNYCQTTPIAAFKKKSRGASLPLEDGGAKIDGLVKSLAALSAKTEDDRADAAPPVDPVLAQETDAVLNDILADPGDEDNFAQLFCLILSDGVNVNHRHSVSGATPLAVAAKAGNADCVRKLLSLGASPETRDAAGSAPIDECGDEETRGLLVEAVSGKKKVDAKSETSIISPRVKEMLDRYHARFDDEQIDFDLCLLLIKHILQNSVDGGAILVFLPGYDEIMQMKYSLASVDQRFVQLRILVLHSKLQTKEHWQVFERPPRGVRKVILSTNIAETSLTIDDVTVVIDSGKVKETAFDSMTSLSLLKSNWISRASALQRRGRAGRCAPGICYRLFSRQRFDSFQEHAVPEIMRVPLEELCLHTKLLSRGRVSIDEYLTSAPDPPALSTIKSAVANLQKMDALDDDEELTEMGARLAEMPLPPHLGKTVLFALAFRCLDPVLVIVSALAYKEPFVLPINPGQRKRAAMEKANLAQETFSDHFALLQAYREWVLLSGNHRQENLFCDRYFLSSSVLRVIKETKTKITHELISLGLIKGHDELGRLNKNGLSWPVVKAVLCAGRYPNLLRVDHTRNQLSAPRENNVRFHASSVMHPSASSNGGGSGGGVNHQMAVLTVPFSYVFYEELAKSSRHAAVKQATCVSSLSVALFTGSSRFLIRGERVEEEEDEEEEEEDNEAAAKNPLAKYLASQSGVEPGGDSGAANDSITDRTTTTTTLNFFVVDDWIRFGVDAETSDALRFLKTRIHEALMKLLKGEGAGKKEDDAIDLVKRVVCEEEAACLERSGVAPS